MTVILDPCSGHALPQKAVRIAEILHDFDPDLELRWIPPSSLQEGDKPYAIWHNSRNHPNGGYIVCLVDNNEMDHRIIGKLFRMRNTSLSQIDADNKALEVMKLKERMDEQEELDAFRKFVIQSDKTVRHNGVTYS